MKVNASLLLLPLISAPLFALDYDQSVEISSALQLSDYPSVTEDGSTVISGRTEWQGSLEGFWNLYLYSSENTQLNARYGLSLQGETRRDFVGDDEASTADYRAFDLDALLLGSESDRTRLYQQLDQLSVTWYSNAGDYTLGRQPISFGLAKFYSPVDIIYPFDLYATDTDYRPGVDALRGTWQLGALTEFDAGWVFGSDSVLFSRFKASVNSIDAEAIVLAINGENLNFSLGTQTAIDEIGLWQETALLLDEDHHYLRTTLGADYTVLSDLYLVAEVHYNGAGARSGYDTNSAGNSFYQLGAISTLGKWYASVQGSYPVNILTSVSSGISVNLNDGSALANLALSVNATDAMNVDLSAVLPLDDEHSYDSEFGLYPAYLLAEVSWVF
ncbi:hypothetical protein BCF53_106142 [Reinekea marinisedimentorum]|uniref:Porin-like protein n=2 Tax=Reinekea marinisedimentorum TaxID=230495 RepID=A0A4V2UJT8_9GAMM|nr:hypothetical protein BCF53_106142 [Reinekea marinisedimentorum]